MDKPFSLSDALPINENMGVKVNSERPNEANLEIGRSFWIQDFRLRHESGNNLDVEAVGSRFEDCFMAVLNGDAENDGLNRLVSGAGLRWREAALLRCYAKHIQQLRLPFSQAYMEDVLVSHDALVRNLVEKFRLQFDPDVAASRRSRDLKKAVWTGGFPLRRQLGAEGSGPAIRGDGPPRLHATR